MGEEGNKAFFGYRAYVAVDTEDGFVDTAMAKPANESETKQFRRVVRKLPEGVDGVLADKGFASRGELEVSRAQEAHRSDPVPGPPDEAVVALAD
ncbi:MAG: transposase [Burkholderiaceae bacterium]